MRNDLYANPGNLPEGFEDPALKLKSGRYYGRNDDERLFCESLKGFPKTIQEADKIMYEIAQSQKPIN